MTDRLITFPELKTEFGISFCRIHVWRLVKAGKFPAPIRPTGGRLFWSVESIRNWVSSATMGAAQ
jgi:predicted DNA-binding transcriptional regulator AlpA